MDAMDRHRHRCREEHHPSFSSTLLDVIYRSIDEREDENIYRKSTRNRQSTDGCFQYDRKQTVPRSRNVSDVVVRRRSATGFESCNSYMSSSIGSTGSRYSAGISSSEAETIYGFPVRPRPIRTNIHDDERNTRETNRRMYDQMHRSDDDLQPSEGKFVKTKSRAMKIYGYLKKGKHPISPGGRLTTFFISLFRTPNVIKKSKVPSAYTGGHEINDDATVHARRKPKSAPNASTCSSTSSFSRSCLSKTPSSGKLATDVKRSVRFYPANVIVNDDYSQPIGHKSLNGDGSDSCAEKFVRSSNDEEVKKHLTLEKKRHRLKKYQRKFEYVFNSIKNNNNVGGSNDEDDDEGGSYASSDLFELEHLCGIGMDGCMQELPLYETTSVDASRPIANGTLLI